MNISHWKTHLFTENEWEIVRKYCDNERIKYTRMYYKGYIIAEMLVTLERYVYICTDLINNIDIRYY